jgi:hypothetical protein
MFKSEGPILDVSLASNPVSSTNHNTYKKILTGLLSAPLILGLQGCTTTSDPMPATKVDVFVLDLSTSNDASLQLQRIQEDITKSLTEKAMGVPKVTPEGEPVSGPVTTIFTFIVDAAPKAETFKLQSAADVRKLWGEEFAMDSERNSKSWSQLSTEYSFYAKSILKTDYVFQKSSCTNDLDNKLKPKFMGDAKRGRIVNVLCNKAETLASAYRDLISYVSSEKAPATDIYGMLSKVDRLVSEVKKEDSGSVITVNIASDMQHETGDSRDTPAKLNALKLESAASCSAGTADREKEGLTFDSKATIRVSGIGNAKITAEYGNALIRYWQCYFPNAEIR